MSDSQCDFGTGEHQILPFLAVGVLRLIIELGKFSLLLLFTFWLAIGMFQWWDRSVSPAMNGITEQAGHQSQPTTAKFVMSKKEPQTTTAMPTRSQKPAEQPNRRQNQVERFPIDDSLRDLVRRFDYVESGTYQPLPKRGYDSPQVSIVSEAPSENEVVQKTTVINFVRSAESEKELRAKSVNKTQDTFPTDGHKTSWEERQSGQPTTSKAREPKKASPSQATESPTRVQRAKISRAKDSVLIQKTKFADEQERRATPTPQTQSSVLSVATLASGSSGETKEPNTSTH